MRLTDIVQRQGERVFYGTRAHSRVCIAPHGEEWAVWDSDKRIVDTGSLAEVLGIQLRDEWRGPGGASYHVTVVDTGKDRLEVTGDRDRFGGTVWDLLDLGWRPEVVDAELREMGVDPEALAERGAAFVEGVKRETGR